MQGSDYKVLVLSKYAHLGASSRLRFYQFIPDLSKKNITFKVCELFNDQYLINFYSGKGRSVYSIIQAYFHRLIQILKRESYDCLWLQIELFPWVPYIIEKGLLPKNIPYILDIDDAIFHQYDLSESKLIRATLGKKIDHLMRNAAVVIVGSEYLKCRALDAKAKKVEKLPTVVDLSRYSLKQHFDLKKVCIGWIGTPTHSENLNSIKDVLKKCSLTASIKLLFVGIDDACLDLPNVEYRKWTEESEVKNLLDIDIGIMPLIETPWSKGKCGYKLIQYMACGLPVVASDVGENSVIVKHAINGFLCKTNQDWDQYLNALVNDLDKRREYGLSGRRSVEEEYCTTQVASKLEAILRMQ